MNDIARLATLVIGFCLAFRLLELLVGLFIIGEDRFRSLFVKATVYGSGSEGPPMRRYGCLAALLTLVPSGGIVVAGRYVLGKSPHYVSYFIGFTAAACLFVLFEAWRVVRKWEQALDDSRRGSNKAEKLYHVLAHWSKSNHATFYALTVLGLVAIAVLSLVLT